MPLKIAVVVQGRFYAFDLVRELIEQKHDVFLLTNYPINAVKKFGIPGHAVFSFLAHGVMSRIIYRFLPFYKKTPLEQWLHTGFSVWCAHTLRKIDCDVVYAFSGVAEELFESLSSQKCIKILVRGSTHIRTQFSLLEEEEKRANSLVDKPSNWMIEREEREYQVADYIQVLSSFAYKSFIENGVGASKLKILPLGSRLTQFRPESQIIEERCQRILSGQPLRVLTVGTFSLQKGAIDLVDIANNADHNFQFRFVGSVTEDAKHLVQMASSIDMVSRKPEFELPSFYFWADIFLFLTIQDGYAVVLSQAQAAGLPIIATPNSAAPDLVQDSISGWILPIRTPDAFVATLQWCHEHRQELAQMVQQVYQHFQPRDWANVAHDFADMANDLVTQSGQQKHGLSS
jgi:glycosyltransferase involved in cell wall biosynthesis